MVLCASFSRAAGSGMDQMAMSAQMFGLILRLHALPSYILHMENKKLHLWSLLCIQSC